jgi:putative SOS response-associated peptidase YedK
MCGRASLPNDVSELKQDLRIEWDKLGDYRPRWNAAPTSDLPVVTSSPDRGRTLEVMRWGLIPSQKASIASRRFATPGRPGAAASWLPTATMSGGKKTDSRSQWRLATAA